MNYIKSIKYFFIITILFVLAIGVINFTVDPFQQYRQAILHKTIFIKKFYLNAGLIKNYDYDSVVIGSSVTENFIINEVNKYLDYNKTIKLPISGGSILEHYTVLNSAIKSGKVKNVLLGLDIFSLNNAPNRLPTYLYDYNIMNDYLYLLSIDTMKRSLLYPFLHYATPETHPRRNYNLMYQWQHNFQEDDFNEKKVLSQMYSEDVDIGENVNQKRLMEERLGNLEKYIVPLIKENPTINYTIFYPPYSILTYKKLDESNILDEFIVLKKSIFDKLSKYDNVKVFDFQIAKDVTFNLNNYRDVIHYHQKINTWILEEIEKNNFLVTKENYKQSLGKFGSEVHNYKIKKEYK